MCMHLAFTHPLLIVDSSFASTHAKCPCTRRPLLVSRPSQDSALLHILSILLATYLVAWCRCIQEGDSYRKEPLAASLVGGVASVATLVIMQGLGFQTCPMSHRRWWTMARTIYLCRLDSSILGATSCALIWFSIGIDEMRPRLEQAVSEQAGLE